MIQQTASALETPSEVIATAANPTPTPAQDKQYASFWTRLVARVIDILLLAIVMGIVGSVVSVGLQAFYPNHAEHERMLFENMVSEVSSADNQLRAFLSNFVRLFECNYGANRDLQRACEQVRSYQYTNQVVMSFLSLVIYTLYFVVSTASNKQGTLGKQFLNIKVINEAGDKVTYGQAFTREIFALGNHLFNLLGYAVAIFNFLAVIFSLGSVVSALVVFFDEKKQAWHDKIAKTYVVKSQ